MGMNLGTVVSDPPRMAIPAGSGHDTRTTTSMAHAEAAARRSFDDATRARFAEYRKTGDRRLRNALVEDHRWLAEVAARRFTNRGEPLDDLLQVALLGLVKAVERFDPGFGSAFASFALPTLFGELRRHFRDTTWSVHVTRRAKELHLEMGGVVEQLTGDLGRSPLPVEVAAAMNATVDDVIQATEAGNAYRSSPLDARTGEDSGPEHAALAFDDQGLAVADARVALQQLMARLAPRERRILELRFFAERTQSEIAEEIGISQVHVSRLLRASLDQLRATMSVTVYA